MSMMKTDFNSFVYDQMKAQMWHNPPCPHILQLLAILYKYEMTWAGQEGSINCIHCDNKAYSTWWAT